MKILIGKMKKGKERKKVIGGDKENDWLKVDRKESKGVELEYSIV